MFSIFSGLFPGHFRSFQFICVILSVPMLYRWTDSRVESLSESWLGIFSVGKFYSGVIYSGGGIRLELFALKMGYSLGNHTLQDRHQLGRAMFNLIVDIADETIEWVFQSNFNLRKIDKGINLLFAIEIFRTF